MSARIPIGAAETQKLEVKSRDALKNPSILGRAAVAMLNADGGSVWVGLREEGGRAVAVEAIEDAEAAKDRLWNHLVDTLEPAPTSDEIAIEVVEDPSGHALLRIDLTPRDDRKPYAHVEKSGRHYVVRVGARVRPMTREEIFSVVPRVVGNGEDPVASTLKTLAKARKEIQAAGATWFWMRLQPSRDLGLDVQGPGMERLLRDPTASGNRAHGWTFAIPNESAQLRQNCLILGDDRYSRTRIHRAGWIDYRAPLEWLRHAAAGEEEQSIYPLALLERTVSIFRLAGQMYAERLFPHGMPDPASRKSRALSLKKGHVKGDETAFYVAADLALIGARGWKLRPYSPGAMGYIARHEEGTLKVQDLLLERPFVFEAQEILRESDRCAFRVLARVYEAFGYSEEKVPEEFDRRSGRLVLPG